jgi:hypothetical protein
MRAMLVIASLLLTTGNGQAEPIYCATMIALGQLSTPRPVINRLRSDIGRLWVAVTGHTLVDADLDQVIAACVDNPVATVYEVIRAAAPTRRAAAGK